MTSRVTQVGAEVLQSAAASVRATEVGAEVLYVSPASVRATGFGLEVLRTVDGLEPIGTLADVTQDYVEVLTANNGGVPLQVEMVYVELLRSVEESPFPPDPEPDSGGARVVQLVALGTMMGRM